MLKQQRHTAYSVGHHSSSSGLRARAIPDKESSGTYYVQVHRLQSILDEVPSSSNDAFARPSILAMFLLQLQVTIISTIEALSYLLRPLERMFLFGTFARCAHQMVRGFFLIALVLAENVSQTFGVDQEMSSLRCNGHNHDYPHPKETIEYQSPYQIESTSAASSTVTDDPQTPDLPTRRESSKPVPESKEEKDEQQEKEEEQEETLNHVDGKSPSRSRCTSTPAFAPVVETKVRTRSLSNNMSVIIAGPPKTSSTSSLPSKSPVLSSFPHHSRPLSLRRVMGQRDLIHGNRSTLAGHSAPMLTTSSSARTTDTEPIYLVHRSLHRSASTTFGAAPGNHRA